MTVGVSSSGSGGRPGVWRGLAGLAGLAGPASGRREITVRASSGVIGSGGRSGGVSGGGIAGSYAGGRGIDGSYAAGGGGIAGSYAGGGGSGWTGASCDSGGEPRP